MTVKVSKPAINVREELADLRKPTGIAGEAMLRAETPQEQFNLIGAGRRNIIINGAMQVAQRGGSFTGLTADAYTLDRYLSWHGDGSTTNVEQSTVVPNAGFSSSLKRTVTTANTSTATNLQNGIAYRVEGYDVNRLQLGTATAESSTLSFWVRSSVIGNYSVMVRNSAGTRYFVQGYTVDVADTWEYKTILITPETSGVWDKVTGKGLEIIWNLAGGTDYDDGVNGTWVTTNERFDASTGQVNWVNTLNATFYLTGVQLELGKVATPFEHRSYGEELALCQRYFQIWEDDGNTLGAGVWYASNQVLAAVPLQQVMRASPTVTVSAANWASVYGVGTSHSTNDLTTSVDKSRVNSLRLNLNMATTTTAGQGAMVMLRNGDQWLKADAEL